MSKLACPFVKLSCCMILTDVALMILRGAYVALDAKLHNHMLLLVE